MDDQGHNNNFTTNTGPDILKSKYGHKGNFIANIVARYYFLLYRRAITWTTKGIIVILLLTLGQIF